MELATQTQLAKLRELLDCRQAELRADLRAAQQARQDAGAADAREVSDQKDEAAQEQRGTLDDAQLHRDLVEFAEVESALGRLDAGSYGDCADCAEPIPLARLQVQPAARRCADCQAAHERAARPR